MQKQKERDVREGHVLYRRKDKELLTAVVTSSLQNVDGKQVADLVFYANKAFPGKAMPLNRVTRGTQIGQWETIDVMTQAVES